MKLTKSQQFFYSCLLFLVGVAIGSLWPRDFGISGKVFLIVVLIFCIFAFLYYKKYRLQIFLLLMLLLGIFWNGLLEPDLGHDHIAGFNGQKTTFQAIVSEEPDSRLDKQKLTVKPIEYEGKVLLNTSLYPEYSYGDLLEVSCKLQTPEPIENFKYDKYLAKSGVYSVCYLPKIVLMNGGYGNYVFKKVFQFKKFVEKKINQSVSEPQASLTSGILIGSRQGIPRDLLDKFNITGITHIIAISGYNITIIVVLLMNLGKHFYINRKRMIWIVVSGLVFFVILTGMSASVVRAAIMGAIVVFASHVGRRGNVRNVLMLSAVVMVMFNPKILIWDAGFQLSFVSTIGLVYLTPVLEKYLKWLPDKLAIRENLTCTMSAIIMTLPLILFQFHRLSIVAPIVNLIVLPTIPIAMFVGFVMFIASMLHPFLGQIVGWIAWLLLGYAIWVVEIFSSFSFASVEIKISWFVMVLMYGVLLFVIFKRKNSHGLV
jgi:competence protein ComEC